MAEVVKRYAQDAGLTQDFLEGVLPDGALVSGTPALPGAVRDFVIEDTVANAAEDLDQLMNRFGWGLLATDPSGTLEDAAKDLTPQYVTSVFGRLGDIIAVDNDYSSEQVFYLPSSTGDWDDEDPDPSDVGRALDVLAARTGLIGGGAQVIADTQATSSSTLTTTTSTTYVDVSGMTLTTDNDGGSNVYIVMFNSEFELNTPNKTLSFRICIDGVPEADSERNIEISSANSPNNGGTFSWQQDVPNGVDIVVQWKVSSGTASMLGRTLIIQGSS